MRGIAAGFTAVTKVALQQYVFGPVRLRRYERRSTSFLFHSPHGLRFQLDPHETVDRHIAVEGIYDGRFLEFIKSVLKPGAVMLDIGANVGNHALFLHDVCSEVHCFEPNPRACARLEQNIQLNCATNVKVHPFGLGARERTEVFLDNDTGNLGGSRFLRPGEVAAQAAQTQLLIKRGDAAIGALNLPRIDFVKIDVEGFEVEVFDGLRETLAKFRPIVSFEHHAHKVPRGEFSEILGNLPDYRIFELTYAPVGSSIAERAAWHFRHRGQPELTEVFEPEQRSYENLLAIPRAVAAELRHRL